LVGWGSGVGLVVIVAGLTFATRAHELPLRPFVASAAKIASGQLWVVPASALIVDRPVLIGLAAFGVLAVTTLRVCGARTFWLAAAMGHVGSTFLVYGIIGSTRLADPHMFTRAVVTPDFGVSAMQGAWVGALTATAWSRAGTDHRHRALVAAGVCALAESGGYFTPTPRSSRQSTYSRSSSAAASCRGGGSLLREQRQAVAWFDSAGTQPSTPERGTASALQAD